MSAPDRPDDDYVRELLDAAPPLDDDQAELIGDALRDAYDVRDRAAS